MGRTIPTKGNLDWFRKYLQAFIGKILHEAPPELKESIFYNARQLQSALNPLSQLERLNRFSDIPEKLIPSNDKTAHMEYKGNWIDVAFENIASNFGKYGNETVSSLEEAVCYSYTLAELFGSHKVFYRGEHHYGYELKSRAERHIQLDEITGAGITHREIEELRRFQKEVRSSTFLKKEIKGKSFFLPRRNSPIWLPIMQHYDEEFGTRLLDISTSIYTGLYFACISWSGEIDTSRDGILYLFMAGNSGMLARGIYYDVKPEGFDDEFDDLAPKNVTQSFNDWKHPEYIRIYKASSSSPREIAQDGWFLVRGELNKPPQYGQGFKFRIPANAKERIAKQLWLTGYTPERMVHGQKGTEARKKLGSILGLRHYA